MTRAADALNLTQGAVSQRIGRLERLCGKPLFERRPGALRLTEAGKRLLGHARDFVSRNDLTWAELASEGGDGRVRLGVPYDLVGRRLGRALELHSASFPEATAILVPGASPDLRRSVNEGKLDLALLEQDSTFSSGERLSTDRLVWVGARNGGAHRADPLLVSLVAPGCVFRPAVEAALAGKGRRWKPVFQDGNLEATREIVRRDLGVSAWLSSTVPGTLSILGADTGLPALPSFAICLLSRREAPRASSGLADALRASFRQAG